MFVDIKFSVLQQYTVMHTTLLSNVENTTSTLCTIHHVPTTHAAKQLLKPWKRKVKIHKVHTQTPKITITRTCIYYSVSINQRATRQKWTKTNQKSERATETSHQIHRAMQWNTYHANRINQYDKSIANANIYTYTHGLSSAKLQHLRGEKC